VKSRANSNWEMAMGHSETQHLPRRHGDKEENRVKRGFLERAHSIWNTALAILREVFDESAYERFLARTGDERSVASYRAFTRERESSLARKPRCC
jgi:hypothetical protein